MHDIQYYYYYFLTKAWVPYPSKLIVTFRKGFATFLSFNAKSFDKMINFGHINKQCSVQSFCALKDVMNHHVIIR